MLSAPTTAAGKEDACVHAREGRRAEVLAADGTRAPFVPSPAQAQAREKFVSDEKGAEVSAQAAWERGMRLLVETAIFMLAGLAMGVRARRRA